MKLLAIDTAANLCAACVYDTEAGERGRAVLDLGKGHAEHLIAVIEQALARAGISYADLGAVAVSVGPGSFTGVRVGVATARGLALALNVPAIGVTTLEALAAEAVDAHPEMPVIAAIDAGRGQVYAAQFDARGVARGEAAAYIVDDAVGTARKEDAVLTGSAAPIIAEMAGSGLVVAGASATADIATYARLAAKQGFSGEKPRPLYLRAADAKPQAGFALPRRSGP